MNGCRSICVRLRSRRSSQVRLQARRVLQSSPLMDGHAFARKFEAIVLDCIRRVNATSGSMKSEFPMIGARFLDRFVAPRASRRSGPSRCARLRTRIPQWLRTSPGTRTRSPAAAAVLRAARLRRSRARRISQSRLPSARRARSRLEHARPLARIVGRAWPTAYSRRMCSSTSSMASRSTSWQRQPRAARARSGAHAHAEPVPARRLQRRVLAGFARRHVHDVRRRYRRRRTQHGHALRRSSLAAHAAERRAARADVRLRGRADELRPVIGREVRRHQPAKRERFVVIRQRLAQDARGRADDPRAARRSTAHDTSRR